LRGGGMGGMLRLRYSYDLCPQGVTVESCLLNCVFPLLIHLSPPAETGRRAVRALRYPLQSLVLHLGLTSCSRREQSFGNPAISWKSIFRGGDSLC
jgi:hypothetical protein